MLSVDRKLRHFFGGLGVLGIIGGLGMAPEDRKRKEGRRKKKEEERRKKKGQKC